MSRFSQKQTFDVYVTNLPDDVDEELLKQEFCICGSVQSVTIRDGKNNAAKFGFVRYFKEEAQDAAASQLNGKYLKGRVVVVRKADQKKKNNSDTTAQNGENKRQSRGDNQANGPRQSDPQKASPEYIEQAILITYVVDACTVYGQLAHRDMAEVSAKLMMEINQYCPVAQPQGQEPPDTNKVYGALFSEDGMWYRCKILPPFDGTGQGSPKVRVHYLDYGNDEVVDSASLVELPMSLASLPPQAHMLIFRGIKPTAETVDDNRKAVQFLQEATEGRSVTARLYSPLQTTSSSTPVEIYDGNASLNDVLIQRGFAAWTSSSSSRPFKGKDASPASASPSSSPSPSKGTTKGSQSPRRAANEGRGLLDTPPLPPNKRPSKAASQQKMAPVGVSNERHQAEMQALMKEITHLKTDKAELVKGCKKYMDEAIKVKEEKRVLQADFQSVKEAAANTLSYLSKFEEKYKTSMQTKVSGLLEMLATLKHIRKQVVIDPDVQDAVENAIALLTDFTDAFVSLRDGIDEEAVKTAQSELRQHQAKFYQPGAKDHLDELILVRDEARKKTYEVMSNFLEVVNQLPLAEKRAKIESSLEELEKTYQHMLQGATNTSLTGRGDGDRERVNVCINYKQWKEKKSLQLKTLRENTDALAAQWRQAVQENLIDPFDLSSEVTSRTAPAFDDLARSFIVAMETEIAMTGQDDEQDLKIDPGLLEKKKEEKGLEMTILTNTVCVVVSQLHLELEAVDYITERKVSYTLTKKDLEKWLDAKPDVSKLQAVHKTIKTLKSRLRHKLADKDDLEEDPELNSGGELQKIEEELASIRLALQKAYVEEDILMEDVSELSRVHFPELSHQCPSFDIEHYLDTLGLVKRGRDLQQFDLKPLPGCDKKMIHLGQFNGIPVVIKSFFIPDDEAREEFLIQSVNTQTFGSEGRLVTDTVYSLPNLGEIHVQLPYIEMGSLEAAIAKEGCFASEPLTNKELRAIFRDVLTGISQLQEHGTDNVHGAIHPRNVLLTSRSSALLAEYDNSKTPIQRAQQAYKSKTGLSFSPPGISNDLTPSSAWDMYSFGMLLLWAHYPEVAFPALPNGTPDLSVVEMSPSMKEVLSLLLNHGQESRPDAAEVMCTEYFVTSPSENDNEQGNNLAMATANESSENKVEAQEGDEVVQDDIAKDEADVSKDSAEIGNDEQQLPENQEILDGVKDQDNDSKEEDDKVTKEEEDKKTEMDTEDAEEVLEEKTVEVESKQVPKGKPEVSSPSTGSILLKKMVAAMATSGDSAKENAAKTPEGSEI